MNRSISILRKIALAYSEVCKPLCRELGLPQTAFDILMFLGNNPAYKTASEIVEIRRLKANLVSVNVEKLVREGYLTRCAVAGDRRKTELLCTEKAAPILVRGRQLQKDFSESLFAGMDEARREAFAAALAEIESNLDAIWRQTNHEYPDNRSGHIFCGHGRGARHRLCRDERRRSHQPHADHLSGR